MEKQDILERIIEEEGNCNWALNHDPDKYYICSRCPMSKLRKKKNGEWMSCWDAIIGEDELNVLDVDEKYVDKAKSLLSDILIEEMIRDE